MKYYKFLDGNQSRNGGTYTWSLPVKNDDGTWIPGEWTEPVEGTIVPCQNGYHLCRPDDLLRWFNRDLYEAEITGEVVVDDEKVVVRSCRLVRKVETWNERTARLFAVWCAREALKLVANPDSRIVVACDVAERYANGEATVEELVAAWSAARDAARVAARVAARDAARVAAWSAARDAAWSAARDAAWSAAWDAAWSAAWDAAWSAAWSAARDAVWSAARDAAWDAARVAQTAHLLEMLGEPPALTPALEGEGE